MEASAEKRSEYLEKVSKYDKEQMVYLDESNIDRTICQDSTKQNAMHYVKT
ncbi:hypothetical protein [Candidatus Tisiphia endosymbiont of Ditula angustiorana]|uniref:hypothetical protein n=1 Tax=Candidatus Tisiphia endosymbiont of Ditula angustiorana TaxID=3066272 RepID=UPI00312C7D0F